MVGQEKMCDIEGKEKIHCPPFKNKTCVCSYHLMFPRTISCVTVWEVSLYEDPDDEYVWPDKEGFIIFASTAFNETYTQTLGQKGHVMNSQFWPSFNGLVLDTGNLLRTLGDLEYTNDWVEYTDI